MGGRLTLAIPRLGWGALLLAGFGVPVLFVRAAANPFMLPKATLVWVVTVVALAGIAVWAVSHRRLPLPPLPILLPMAALVTWTAVACAFSPTPITSVLGQYGRYDGLVSVVTGVLVALLVAAYTWRAPERLEGLVLAIVASGGVSLAYVLIERAGWDFIDWSTPGQIVGLAGNANFSGAYLALVVPFVLGLRARTAVRSRRAGLVAGALLLSLGVWATGTRGGLVALLGAVAVFGLLVPELLPKAIRIAALIAAAAAIAVVLASSLGGLPGRRAIGNPAVLDTVSLDQRQNIWSGAADMIRSEPLVGVGPDAFGLAFPDHRSSRPGRLPLINADEAHNTYLDRAATAGLPALAAYLWLVGSAAAMAWRARNRIAAEHRWLLGAFGGAFGGYLLQAAFSIDAVPLAFLSWLCLGAVLALADPALGDARSAGADPGTPTALASPALVGIAAIVLALLIVSVRPLLADLDERRGIDAAAAHRSASALTSFTAAADGLQHEPRYQVRIAEQLITIASEPSTAPDVRRRFLREAQIAYDHALDRSPGDVMVLEAKARTYLLSADAAPNDVAADAAIGAAGSIYRHLFRRLDARDDLHVAYGRWYELRARVGSTPDVEGDRTRAARQYQLARAYRPDAFAALQGLARLAVDRGRFVEARAYLVQAERVAPPGTDLSAVIAEVDRRIRQGS